MPAEDKVHEAVVNALVKAGWQIVDEQHYITVGTTSEEITQWIPLP